MKVNKMVICSLCLICVLLSVAKSASDDSVNLDCRSALKDEQTACYKKVITNSQIQRAENSSNLDAWYKESDSYFQIMDYVESYQLCDQVLGNTDFQGKDDLNRFRLLKADSDVAYEKLTGERITAGPEDRQPEAYQTAFILYDEVIKHDANNSRAWNNKGVALAEMENYTGSIYCFDKAIEIDPGLAETWNNKGVSLDLLDRHSEALTYYGNATVLNPSLAEAYYNKARTLNILGMPGADEYYQKGKELDEKLEGKIEYNWLYKIIS